MADDGVDEVLELLDSEAGIARNDAELASSCQREDDGLSRGSRKAATDAASGDRFRRDRSVSMTNARRATPSTAGSAANRSPRGQTQHRERGAFGHGVPATTNQDGSLPQAP